MTQPLRTADLDVVVPRMVTAVQASLTAFVVMAVSRRPLDLELSVSSQLFVLLLLVSAALAVTGCLHRRRDG